MKCNHISHMPHRNIFAIIVSFDFQWTSFLGLTISSNIVRNTSWVTIFHAFFDRLLIIRGNCSRTICFVSHIYSKNEVRRRQYKEMNECTQDSASGKEMLEPLPKITIIRDFTISCPGALERSSLISPEPHLARHFDRAEHECFKL